MRSRPLNRLDDPPHSRSAAFWIFSVLYRFLVRFCLGDCGFLRLFTALFWKARLLSKRVRILQLCPLEKGGVFCYPYIVPSVFASFKYHPKEVLCENKEEKCENWEEKVVAFRFRFCYHFNRIENWRIAKMASRDFRIGTVVAFYGRSTIDSILILFFCVTPFFYFDKSQKKKRRTPNDKRASNQSARHREHRSFKRRRKARLLCCDARATSCALP